MDISLFLLLEDGVQHLRIAQRAEGCNGQNLRLTAGEHTGTVCARQYADLGCQRTDFLHAAAVDALALGQPLADDLLAQLVYDLSDLRRALGRNFLAEELVDLSADDLHSCVTYGLVVGVECNLNLCACKRLDLVEQVVIDIVMLVLELRLADLLLDFLDECAHLLDLFVSDHQCVEHIVLRHFLCAGLDHDDLLLGAAHRDVHQASLTLLERRVEDDLAVDDADIDTGNRVVKRDIRNGNRDGCTVQTGDLRRVVVVVAHDGAHDGNIVAQVLREQRAHRAVNLAGGDGSLLACLALAAHEGARDAAYRIQLLLKINGEREEINAVARLRGCSCGAEHNGVAVADQCRTVCQLRHLACLNRQLASGKRRLKYAVFIKRLFGNRSHAFISFIVCFGDGKA